MIVDHVALKSLNIQRDSKWYCDNFECKVENVDDTWALLSTKGGCKIALVTAHEHPPHLAFLQQGEVAKSAKLHRDGTSSVYTKDPSGNFVELLWRPD